MKIRYAEIQEHKLFEWAGRRLIKENSRIAYSTKNKLELYHFKSGDLVDDLKEPEKDNDPDYSSQCSWWQQIGISSTYSDDDD